MDPESPIKEKVPLNEESVESQPSVKLEIPDTDETPEKEHAAIKKVNEVAEKVKSPAIGITVVLFLILNIAMFFVGVTTTNQCPKRPIIPIYLAVAGAIGIVSKVLTIVNRKKQMKILSGIASLLFLIEFIWMILGSYWIYGIYEPSYNSYDVNDYCNKTAYLMGFWLLTLHYIYLLILICIPCFIMYACGVAILCCGQKLISFAKNQGKSEDSD